MSLRNLRDLNISPEQIESTTKFLEAYANTALIELDEIAGTGRKQGTRAGRRPAINQGLASDVTADAATTLRELGQWLLYVDSERSRAALLRSGQLFHSMGQAFGTYLQVVAAGPDELLPNDLLDEPIRALNGFLAGEPSAETQWGSLRFPQQQAYLMLAASGHRDTYYRLNEIRERSMHGEGVVPVGALGMPIRRLWDVAEHLRGTRLEALQVISRHLSVMCRHYAETIELAQVNNYLWSHGASPVDVGDIDIAGIAAMTARRFGGDALIDALGRDGLRRDDDRIALAPVEAGLALAEPWRSQPRKAGN